MSHVRVGVGAEAAMGWTITSLRSAAGLGLAVALSTLFGVATAEALAAPGFPVAAEQSFRDAPWSPQMVVIPPGRFEMGASEAETKKEGKSTEKGSWERPIHPVVVTHAFAMGKLDVTRAEFKRFLAETHRSTDGGCMVYEHQVWAIDPTKSFFDPASTVDDRYPATCVDWRDATAYVQWLSKATGHRYRLPTEAEWEYAARAGTTGPRWWGDRRLGLCGYLNGADASYDRAYPGQVRVDRSCDDGYVQTSPLGIFPPNPFGLYDMYGDVEQWTEDCFADSYVGAPGEADTPVHANDCQRFAVRGGTWHSDAPLFRAANRGFLPASMRASSVGFRVVRLAD
jgi:sulfatase modifying factor 1